MKVKDIAGKTVLAGAALLAVLSGAQDASAVEGGATITPFGLFDFGAGMSPPPTPYGAFGLQVMHYTANKGNDVFGKDNGVDLQLDVTSVTLSYIKMTEIKLLGAAYGFGVAVPLMNLNGSFDVGQKIADKDFNIGDAGFIPLILQWDLTKNWYVNTAFQIQAPTGHYDVNNPFSAGVNHWTFAPTAGVTYLSDSGWEVSSRIEISFNTVNRATNYTSGIEYKQEFAVGKSLGAWTIGAGGYAYQQLTDDKGQGIVKGNRSRAFAAGPAIAWFEPGLPAVNFHAYKEFGTRNRPEGYNLSFRISHAF
ncbi:MAG: hypothetical protein C0457_12890 [Polymorphum sp.]|nr:hypothetical protein [Polymorphum sp.]